MKAKVRFILAIFMVICCGILTMSATEFNNESLKYKVMFKWGLINKHAGDVVIDLQKTNGRYHSQLAAKSASWADKFYKVRDTLRCEIIIDGFKPVKYEKIAHEDKDFKHDVVTYGHKGDTAYGYCTRYETRDGKVRKDEKRTLEAFGTTVDMLSAFYYLRNLPFQNWQPEHAHSLNIFSGKRKEQLTLKYHGIEKVKCDDITYNAYKVTFIFTSNDGKKTSDNMYAWIDTTTRLPVKLEGKLPVGSVKCFLIN